VYFDVFPMPGLGKYEIGIVGNGLSAYLVLKHLVALAPDVKIALFNSDHYKAIEGPAYLKNAKANFFLNTPSNKIALSDENAYDFCDFLGLSLEERDWHFASRTEFGQYAKSKLAHYDSYANQFGSANKIKRNEEGFEIHTNEGIVTCNKILLATGNDFDNAWQGVIKSVWNFDYSVLKPTDKVIVIGTGLTMFDIVGAISDNCKEVTITAISKSGLMPAVQPAKATTPIPFVWDRDTPISLFETLRQLRKNLELANGEWWRTIDGMRPVTIDLWNNFSVFEKKQFINHLLSKWNRARHRAPQQVFEKVNGLIQNKALEIRQGKVVQASANFVKLADRTILNADYVFYAGGAILNPFKSSQPFWQNVKEEDWIDIHPSGMGVNATPKFQLIGKDGAQVNGAYTIGNNMRGTLLECTAIPELKVHAKKVAEQLLG
jgi:uncharacterized NAD(P)/FAD-binding protein YdhS